MLKLQHRLEEAQFVVDNTRLWHSGFNLGWIKELEIEPKVIFDVGACDFGDAIRFKQHFQSAEVYSFELNHNNYIKYCMLAERLGVNTEGLAVSDSNLTIPGYYQSTHSSSAQSTLLKPTDRYKEKYGYIEHSFIERETQQIRLDTYCQNRQIKYIDIVHSDLEGGELKMLVGLGEMRPKLIFLEYLVDGGWEGQNFESVDKWFSDNKYELLLDSWPDRLYWRKNG